MKFKSWLKEQITKKNKIETIWNITITHLCKWKEVEILDNWDYKYQDSLWYEYLMRNDKDWNKIKLCKAKKVESHNGWYYSYKDRRGFSFLLKDWHHSDIE